MEAPDRILLVEDSETQALKFTLMLEKEGWEVVRAATAEAALEELGRERPELIVVDYHLPGIQGDEFCRRVRMNVNTRAIPILMLTVEETDSSQLRGLESGADDYVVKSVDDEVLVLRVRTLLRKPHLRASVLDRSDTFFQRAQLLAIDDSPTYLEYVTEELRREGFTVESALSGREGLDLLARQDFDCVLVDLVMPEMNGLEVCRRINEMRRNLDNPIVVLILTAHETKEDMTRGLEAGADDFVGKSSDMAVLKARIRALLRRKFFHEENNRIIQELKAKELEAVRARAEKEAAEARAALAEKLSQASQELEQTNRKLRETQMHLIQSEKMASLGQLVAGIAHEINNPLSFVLNNLFTLGRDFERIAEENQPRFSKGAAQRLAKVRSRLTDMQTGLEQVRDLVLKLRTFSRLDEGEFKTVDIRESIDSVLLFLQHKMKGQIKVEKNYGSPEIISCYAGQINQVLMNIVANAVEAIAGQGKITITTGQENGTFFISIRDSGKGIPENIRHRIFEPFFTTKPVGQGTGLGLAIAYGIIQAHRGSIEVQSTEGEGTEFIVRIPLQWKEA